uniref:DOC domain-containing protein n=1 Tax=Fibrocapsa japonica TaxID=94617 RepID=A0A7S2UYX9_9STRA|mmetsp:Transcript_2122/g.3110  ORF Transcript_2122/g.3110 Transcript_2122/m.3110 type:complete len:251 (+) Transcript_2122:129-881(+)|eukprot:CAMPEP_0113945388 /NCGR_PEP_ID=MMETSP1339-20121228/45203_1 /TAXON_ID=94617 /ORGANISM="Fibrocapsa japonica" /LENGTH=250 /DNA_ID=CAMNT_0000950955 /DNA_START=36 /DNA_END=788 /DNA_ORIENTATION=+ /assembly_acc=CAM_ASM_000762
MDLEDTLEQSNDESSNSNNIMDETRVGTPTGDNTSDEPVQATLINSLSDDFDPQQGGGPNFREIGNDAMWVLSTAKPGNGVGQLRDGNMDTFWQSDGPMPHQVNLHFHCKATISCVSLYLDYNLDESYTPLRLCIKAGNTQQDLADMKMRQSASSREWVTIAELSEPVGWVNLPLQSPSQDPGLGEGAVAPVKAHLVQIAILAMHQNGMNTHVRQIKVFGPRTKPAALLELNKEMPEFSTVEFSQYSTIR